MGGRWDKQENYVAEKVIAIQRLSICTELNKGQIASGMSTLNWGKFGCEKRLAICFKSKTSNIIKQGLHPRMQSKKWNKIKYSSLNILFFSQMGNNKCSLFPLGIFIFGVTKKKESKMW